MVAPYTQLQIPILAGPLLRVNSPISRSLTQPHHPPSFSPSFPQYMQQPYTQAALTSPYLLLSGTGIKVIFYKYLKLYVVLYTDPTTNFVPTGTYIYIMDKKYIVLGSSPHTVFCIVFYCYLVSLYAVSCIIHILHIMLSSSPLYVCMVPPVLYYIQNTWHLSLVSYNTFQFPCITYLYNIWQHSLYYIILAQHHKQ